MVENKIILNYQTNEVIIPVVLQPRTEILVGFKPVNHAEDETIIIEKQEIMKSIICSNATATKVQNKMVLAPLMNSTEKVIKLKMPKLTQIVHEEFKEALIHSIQVINLQEE